MTATESAERSTVLGCSAMGCHRVWGEAAGRSHCSTVLSFHTLFLISIPWDQCRNFDHLSSVRTRLELTLALVFAAGQWVSLTETLRPFRWLLPSSVALSLSLSFSLTVSLSAAALTPFLFYPLSHLLFSSRPSFPPLFLFFSHPLLPPFLHSPSLSVCQKRQQSRWSANLLSFPQCIVVCVCVPCWTRDSGVIRFPVTARDPKTMSEVWSIAGQVPAAGGRDDGWDLDIIASSDDKAAGQGWEAYCQMFSITDDSLLITE